MEAFFCHIYKFVETFSKNSRFRQAEIDLKFQSIPAICGGDLDLLRQSLPHVDMQMAISLTVAAVENDQLHLLDSLCAKVCWLKIHNEEPNNMSYWNSRRSIDELTIFDSLLKVRDMEYSAIEPLLYAGLDATPYSLCSANHKPRPSLVRSIGRSKVLCLFKLLYHKFIYLDVNSISHLLQTLLVEGVYDADADADADAAM